MSKAGEAYSNLRKVERNGSQWRWHDPFDKMSLRVNYVFCKTMISLGNPVLKRNPYWMKWFKNGPDYWNLTYSLQDEYIENILSIFQYIESHKVHNCPTITCFFFFSNFTLAEVKLNERGMRKSRSNFLSESIYCKTDKTMRESTLNSYWPRLKHKSSPGVAWACV